MNCYIIFIENLIILLIPIMQIRVAQMRLYEYPNYSTYTKNT